MFRHDPKRRCAAHSKAFTLIELLVVVTIIAILLALLVPALDKAMYHTLLMRCGVNQKLTAATVIQYTFDNKRYYPKRPDLPRGDAANSGGGVSPWAVFLPTSSVPTGYDMRPILRDQLGLNANTAFQCPLIVPIDVDARQEDEYVYGNQGLWFGWYYFDRSFAVNQNINGTRAQVANGGTAHPGMFRYGDRFVHKGKKYNLLVSDIDLYRPTTMGDQTSHPDQFAKRMYNAIYIRVNVAAAAALPHTASFWHDPVGQRGTVDNNFAYDDGSVRRLNQLKNKPSETRTDDLSNTYDNRTPSDTTQVPRQ